MNDDAATALAAALDTIGENRAADDIAKLRKALALRGYTVVPIPTPRVEGDRTIRHPDLLAAVDLTLVDGMCVDTLLDGVARLADRGARGGGARWTAGEAALVLRAIRARHTIRVTDPDCLWADLLRQLARGGPVAWEAEACEAVRGVLFTAGYPRDASTLS